MKMKLFYSLLLSIGVCSSAYAGHGNNGGKKDEIVGSYYHVVQALGTTIIGTIIIHEDGTFVENDVLHLGAELGLSALPIAASWKKVGKNKYAFKCVSVTCHSATPLITLGNPFLTKDYCLWTEFNETRQMNANGTLVGSGTLQNYAIGADGFPGDKVGDPIPFTFVNKPIK